MSDSRILRITELKKLAESAANRVEQLQQLRRFVVESPLNSDLAKHDSERVWLISTIDNRRALLLDRIVEYQKGIQIARENAQPEIGALYIDGKMIDPDEFFGSYGV